MQLFDQASSSCSSVPRLQHTVVCCNVVPPSPAMRAMPASRLGKSGGFHGLTSRRRGQQLIVHTYPEPETEKERSTIDFPQEWITPQPSRRPDIFPEFEKLETPLPKKLPGDPELPEDEEEEQKEKEKEDPEKDPEEEPEQPQQPPPEE